MSYKPSISYSQLSMFDRCAYQYWLHYVDPERVRPPKGLWSALGRAVHASVADNLRRKMAGLGGEHHGLRAAREFDRLIEENEYVIPGADKQMAIGESRAMAIKLAELHARDVAPWILPWKIEERIELDHGDHYLVAVVDVAERVSSLDIPGLPPHDPTVLIRIRDTKTGSRKPEQDAATRSLQLRVYGYVLRAKEGVTPALGCLDVLMKQAEPVYHGFSTMLDDAALDVVEPRLEQLLAAREKGLFPPASPDAWYCSHQGCDYWDVCPYALRPVTFS